jgi:DNA-binding transcriptional LysR family regulator
MSAELRQMRYFVAVAERRSFTRAAADMYVAQQALSQQVKALEETLGVKLLDRTSRRVELTPAGAAYLEDCRRVLAAVRRAEEHARAVADGTAGRLRLAYTVATAYDTVPVLIADLTRRFPQIKVQSREVFGGDIARLLAEDQYSLAIAPQTSYPAGFTQQVIRREPLRAAVGADHPLAAAARVSMRQLRAETFQLWPRDMAPGYYDAVLDACRSADFVPSLDETGSGTTAWMNIAEGRGVNLIVASATGQLPRDIVLLELDDQRLELPISLVHRNDLGHPALPRILDHCAKLAHELHWLP